MFTKDKEEWKELMNRVLKDSNDNYIVPRLSPDLSQTDDSMSPEDQEMLFHLVYVDIPRKMKSGLRPDADKYLTMDEYLK